MLLFVCFLVYGCFICYYLFVWNVVLGCELFMFYFSGIYIDVVVFLENCGVVCLGKKCILWKLLRKIFYFVVCKKIRMNKINCLGSYDIWVIFLWDYYGVLWFKKFFLKYVVIYKIYYVGFCDVIVL